MNDSDFEEGRRVLAQLGDYRGMSEMVCVCNGIPKQTIQKAIEKLKARDVEEVSQLTSAATGCGTCAWEIEQMIQAYWESHPEESLMKNTHPKAAEVIAFWLPPKGELPGENFQKMWFGKSTQVDQEIREKFGAYLESPQKESLGKIWGEGLENQLAHIILLDQFSRNLFRESAKAFENDAQALSLARDLVSAGDFWKLDGNGKLFVLLPYEHSEDVEVQQQGLDLWDELVIKSEGPWKEHFQKLKIWAIAHQKVIQEFGRFPHRNKVLSRPSTPEEEKYLAQPGAGF